MATRTQQLPRAGTALLRLTGAHGRLAALLAVLLLAAAGCSSAPRNPQAIRAYYAYDFTTAREELRGNTFLRNDEQTILDHLRLGAAAMADGDLDEAERAFRPAFELLSTAGLNEDRTTAAVLMHEGVRIWKGEPFEQALAYAQIAMLYALKDDWENARAAISNALFRLADFGAYRSKESIARHAVRDDVYLDDGYHAVESDFALGYLLLAIAADQAGSAGAREAFDSARRAAPQLTDIINRFEARDYDTILMVEYGKGPTKIATGPDQALSIFRSQDRGQGPLSVIVGSETAMYVPPITDVNQMAADLRWNAMEDVRLAKSALGDALLLGGAIVTFGGGHHSTERTLIGAGMMIAGFLAKSGARADTRYNEFIPQRIFLVPLHLERSRAVHVSVAGGPPLGYLLPDLAPGTPARPRTVYVRLHGPDSPQPAWLAATRTQYGNDHTDVNPGDGPWLLGGSDVSTPSRRVAEAYAAARWIDAPRTDLIEQLYDDEGIVIGSGAETRPDTARNPSYRHILEGGRGLFTPHPDSMGYKRLMYQVHPPYRPRSAAAGNAAEPSRVSSRTNQMENFP